VLTRQSGSAQRTKSLSMLLSVLACLAVAAPARAEWFADLYLGGAFTEKHDVDFNGQPGRETTLGVSVDESFAGGIRGGYWFPLQLGPVNFGVGLDLSHFRPNIGRQARSVCFASRTVHAPHTPAPQPYLVPVRPSRSRNTQSSGISGGASTLRFMPFTTIA